ncbi:MAG: D-alanyl-D-alanine carboxypeptidase, partial [Chitinophagaceae bacterium]|nr:D-alanyl-D-alanine carboxypeptidase [Chitinophagaceae bacterium]
QQVPFITNGAGSAIGLLKNSIGKTIVPIASPANMASLRPIYTQHADSLFQPMMYNSDNFFAEQTLLMAALKVKGVMNEKALIDALLSTDLKNLPQKPRWVDGSGLSRYNLFSPDDFVWILNKMKDEFGIERLKGILPTGGKGTLKGYYQKDSAFIFAKTGTLSGQLALSGFLITQKNRLILFSVLINNHQSNTSELRKLVEKFLSGIRNRY